jgi:hypothetical protein
MSISTIVNKRQSLKNAWFKPPTEFLAIISQLSESGAIVSRTVEESQDGYTQTVRTEFKDFEEFRKFSQIDTVQNYTKARSAYNFKNNIETTVSIK